MAKTVATIMGAGFLLVGIIGFVAPTFLGMHLSMTHNVIHLVTGAASLWLGLKGSLHAARTFCIAFGAVYALLGVAGFIFGSHAGAPGVPGGGGPNMWHVIPGAFEIGRPDHIVHIILGAVYLIGGFATRTTHAHTATHAH